jgi:hypothetical protein
MTDYVPGGFILLSRKLLQGKIMEAPHLWLKLWVWMLLKAQYKQGKGLARGQFLTRILEMREAMTYRIGYRVVKPSVDQIRSAYDAFAKAAMIITTKTTRGIIITILNYNKYQSPENYENHNEAHDESSAKPGIPPHLYNKKKDKEIINPEIIISMRARYSDQKLIDSVFQAIGSTRKSGKAADSVLVAQLRKWAVHPVGQVEAGIRIYLDKDYPAQGKGEAYLMGIIRNHKAGDQTLCNEQGSGSPLLDRYYAGITN